MNDDRLITCPECNHPFFVVKGKIIAIGFYDEQSKIDFICDLISDLNRTDFVKLLTKMTNEITGRML